MQQIYKIVDICGQSLTRLLPPTYFFASLFLIFGLHFLLPVAHVLPSWWRLSGVIGGGVCPPVEFRRSHGEMLFNFEDRLARQILVNLGGDPPLYVRVQYLA